MSDLVALVLDMHVLLAKVGLSSPPGGLGIKLYERHKRLVDSTADSLPRDPERIMVDIRDGNWELVGGPSAGWAARPSATGTRVLFVSGYPQDVERSGPVTLTDASFLAKPFTPGELLDAVQRALNDWCPVTEVN